MYPSRCIEGWIIVDHTIADRRELVLILHVRWALELRHSCGSFNAGSLA